MMDYEQRLIEAIESVGVGFPVYTDTNADESSISLVSLPSSTTIAEYYDGVKDKRIAHEIQIKAKPEEREAAVDALTRIAFALDGIEDIPSNNGSYEFGGITVTNEVFFSDSTVDNIFFRMQMQTELTVLR